MASTRMRSLVEVNKPGILVVMEDMLDQVMVGPIWGWNQLIRKITLALQRDVDAVRYVLLNLIGKEINCFVRRLSLCETYFQEVFKKCKF